jgi:hypothetical protein
VALGILRALDPPRTDVSSHSQKAHSEERFAVHSDTGHRDKDREKDLGDKKEKWTFWNRDKDREKEKEKDKERERERERLFEREREGIRGKERKEDESQAELTRMIGMIESRLLRF